MGQTASQANAQKTTAVASQPAAGAWRQLPSRRMSAVVTAPATAETANRVMERRPRQCLGAGRPGPGGSACAFTDSSLGQASKYPPARSTNGSTNSILLATVIACRQKRRSGHAASRPDIAASFCGPRRRQYDLVSSGFTRHGCLAIAARIRRNAAAGAGSSRRSESHQVSCAACRRRPRSSRRLDPAAGTCVTSFRRADACRRWAPSAC